MPTGDLQPTCHQLLLLRAPQERLASALPDGWAPLQRQGHGFCVVEYHCGFRGRLGQIAIGGQLHTLSLRVPAIDSEGETGQWTVQRFTSSRLLRILNLRRNAQESTQEADFQLEIEGLGTQIEVRTAGHLVLTAQTAATPFLQDSLFGAAPEAERWLASTGRPIQGRRLAQELDPLRLTQSDTCLQPLWVPRFQSASLPLLFPDLDSEIELDSAFRVTRRRAQPVQPRQRGHWSSLSEGGYGAPPEGAFSIQP